MKYYLGREFKIGDKATHSRYCGHLLMDYSIGRFELRIDDYSRFSGANKKFYVELYKELMLVLNKHFHMYKSNVKTWGITKHRNGKIKKGTFLKNGNRITEDKTE
jgi:hypothetical protein